jgi:toxin FitB
MNVVDSSAWLEYLTDGSNAGQFAPAIEDIKHLAVPAVCIFEVFKKILKERDENAALQVAGLMNYGLVIPIDMTTALAAARLSIELKLPMADSLVLACARSVNGTVWTQDADFKGLPGVKFFPKK